METQLTPLQKDLQSLTILKSEIDKIGANCQQIQVVDDSTLAVAQQNLSKAANIASTIEAKRKLIKQPYLDGGKLVDSTAKTLTEGLEKGVAHIKSQIASWEKKRLAEAAEAQRKLEEDLAALTVNSTTADTETLSILATEAKANLDLNLAATKTKGIRYTWDFEVADFNLVPKEWLMVDDSKVKEFIRDTKDDLRDGQVYAGIKFVKKMGVTA